MEKRYKLRALRGTLMLTDAAPVRAHVQRLIASGLTTRQIVEAANISRGALRRLLWGSDGFAPSSRISTDNAHAILAIPVETMPTSGLVSALGSRRRLQALSALGWARTSLAQRTGLSHTTITLIRTPNGTKKVAPRTAHAIKAVYERLADTLPTTDDQPLASTTRTRNYARRAGWLPPGEWDDDQIDHPETTPPAANPEPRYLALAFDAHELINEQRHSLTQAAERLSVSPKYLQKCIERARNHNTDRKTA
ncbi:hypothetical protein [Actinocorallia herbida]|uniref:hypothetical protein n=1 Tax=Actinocorallia herbida TaxID=58109 RepID=UPI000F4B1C43|nr:hypothetical protein [Actinocorallia herbida]